MGLMQVKIAIHNTGQNQHKIGILGNDAMSLGHVLILLGHGQSVIGLSLSLRLK